MAEEIDVEAIWMPALRNHHGHTICDQKIAALEAEVASLGQYVATLEQDNNHLRGLVEELTNPGTPNKDLGAEGKALRHNPRHG
jgi:hypothetical protein